MFFNIIDQAKCLTDAQTGLTKLEQMAESKLLDLNISEKKGNCGW